MSWHATNLSATEPETPTPVRIEIGDAAALLAFGDKRWWAFEDQCSHAACSFSTDGEIDGFTAICDCHGSEFDIRSGAVLAPPANEPIRTYPVRIVAGMVEIEQ